MAFVGTPMLGAFRRTGSNLRSSVTARRWRVRSAGAVRMMADVSATKGPREMTDAEWKAKLSPMEYNVLRQKGTERPGSGEYDKFYPSEGHFVCRACANPLYSAEAKFKSGCGWPAFDKCYKGAIKVEVDYSFGMRRVELLCNECDGHLGHVFEGERMTPTNERHCVNSISVKYVEGNVEGKEEAKLM